jgi:two-component system, LytTR family, response regulator
MNKKIRVAIVEDEPMSLATLEDMLLDFEDKIEIVGRANSHSSACKMITDTKIDLLFLDIYLPDGDGFDILKQFENPEFKVIFTTAYDQHALQAFSVAAIHYLLKPIHPDLLEEAINRFLATQPTTVETPIIPLSHLTIHSQDDVRLLLIADILYCEADASYTIFYLKNNQKCIASKPLGAYEKILPTHLFSRVHYKYLANLSHIKRYLKGKGGQIEFQNGKLIDVSVRKKQTFLQQLEIYLGQQKNS